MLLLANKKKRHVELHYYCEMKKILQYVVKHARVRMWKPFALVRARPKPLLLGDIATSIAENTNLLRGGA